MTTNKDIESAKEDQVEMRQTAPCYSPVVDQSHLQLSAERRDLVARLRSSLSTYAAQAHIRSGSEKTFSACESAKCVRARTLIDAAITAVENWDNPITQDSASASELSTNSPESLRPETKSEFAVQDGEQQFFESRIRNQAGSIVYKIFGAQDIHRKPPSKITQQCADLQDLIAVALLAAHNSTRVTTPVVEENQNEAESV